MPEPGGSALRELRPPLATTMAAAPEELFAPVGGRRDRQLAMTAPGIKPGIGGKILFGADVDQRRGVCRADEAVAGLSGEILSCRMTSMRPRERYGTQYLGMSPRGGIAEPPWAELTAWPLRLSTGSRARARRMGRAQRNPSIVRMNELMGFAALYPSYARVLAPPPAFGPSFVRIGDEAGSPSDGPPSKLCAPLDVSRMAHGRTA